MRKLMVFALFLGFGLTGCSGSGTFNIDFKTSTPGANSGAAPTAAAAKTGTPPAEAAEQPPAPSGGQETSTTQLPPDIVAFIQLQMVGQSAQGSPHVFIVHENVTVVESQFTQQLNTRGWQNVSSSSGPGGKTKVMVMQKGKTKTHVFFINQSNAETLVYLVMTMG